MGNGNWWWNRAGKVAPVSNPGSGVPNYGLTYDLATAPYDGPDQFDAMASALQSYQQRGGLLGLVHEALPDHPYTLPEEHKTLWDRAKGAASFVGDQAAAGLGFMEERVGAASGKDAATPDNLESWSDYQKFGKESAAKGMATIAEQPVAKQVFWGLEKLNEYSSTAMVAATLAEDDSSLIFKSGTWGDAHELSKQRHLNAGEAFAQMFYDKEVILDEDRFEQIRQHNTVFNVGALAFNVVAAWKTDPNVIFGKGIGAARDLSMGKLATNGRTREVQRDILGASDLDAAKAKAGEYTGVADKLRATHAVSLFDRAQQLRETALAARASNGFEDFKNLPAFRNSASGSVLAKLMMDVAHNDADWNLVFRSAIGDPDAIGELIARQGSVADKVSAIEMRDLPLLQSDLERVEARYAKRLAEQGKPQDAAIEITRFGDKWLHDEATTLRAEADAMNARLAGYEEHESWLQRALPGVGDPSAPDLDAMRNAPNAVFGTLDRLGGEGAVRRSLPSLGGSAKVWQYDDYSPQSWIFRAPSKPNLKRVGAVSLNDVEEGGSALTHYLDQLDYIRKGKAPVYRNDVLSAWAGATTDMERKLVVERLEREAVSTLGEKHGLSPELMTRLGEYLQDQRKQAWGKFSDTTMYSPIRGARGRELEWVEGGNKIRVRMPVDPTQLANYHSLANLTDLDRLIRLHRDELRDMDKELVSMSKAGLAKGARYASELTDSFGTWFNSLWKPLALLSIRWPARVVADESMRVMLAAGVLTHLGNLPVGARNALYNTGVVRPYEWWAGRKIRTGSLAEDSLRAGTRNDFDAYDYRAITNPTATVPDSEIDFGKIDGKRYDKINETTAKRWQYLRSLEAHRGLTREARKVSPQMGDAVAAFTTPERPKWALDWDAKLSAAERSTERGFFFDPITRRHSNTGFAVSVYPGRLRTFERKPSAREMNYWVEKNSDLLAVPTNRVAVWLDKDTGRWHLDVVKTTKRREDAMLLASRAEATEFYDIGDGFTRFMSEDFYNHFESPFVKPVEPNPAGGAAQDQAALGGAVDEIGSQIGAAARVGRGPVRKKIGFGTQTWRSRDGRKVQGEGVFGADTENPNIYYGVTSSKGAIQNLFSGHARTLGRDRRSRGAMDYKSFDPDNGDGTVEEWAKAYAHFVNNHVRYSDIWQKMAAGESDDAIFEWLMSTAKGRELRKRMGARGENPHNWVDNEREIFDHLFPTERSLEAAKLGELDPKDVPALIPEGQRPSVHGDTIKLALGQHAHQKFFTAFVDKAMHVLGTMPTDALVRHPFAKTVYNREMRNYLASVPGHKITNDVLAAAEASARAKAVKQVRKVLYNIADEREAVHMLRFVSPFFQAQVEVLEKYAHLIMEKPETLARIGQLLLGSQVLNTGLWQVTDRDGKPAKGYDNNNQVIFQVTPTLRGLVDHIPGLKGSLDRAGDITVPVASLNLILQGDKPYLPSMGPIVAYPASEFYFKGKPELEKSAVYQWMYPFGTPRGGNFLERGLNSVLPAYARRGMVWGSEDMSDPAFARRVSEIGAQMLYAWEKSGKDGPRPTERQALEAAKNEYRLRAASSFFLPAPVTPRSPFQFYIDQNRLYKEKYGLEADEKFYDDFGPEFFMFAQQATESVGGMGPNIGEKKAYDKYKGLAERAPDLIGVLTGPFATPEFSDAVYQWQLGQRVSPASSDTLRERLSPAQRIAESEVGRGWVEYGKLASAIDAEIRNRVAQGGSPYLTANSNADLAQIKQAKVREIIDRNPAWNDAYNSRSAHLGSWLGQAYDVAFDKSLDGRSDIEALRAYLIGRARLQDALGQREASGLSSSDQLSFDPTGNPIGDNADLAVSWTSWVNEIKSQNPLFAEIYNRYLESDDLSTYISPEVSGGAQ